MKSKKAASLSSGLLARKGDAAPASIGGFESSEPDEIPPFAKENDLSPDFVAPGLDATGANAPDFGSSGPNTDDEVPLIYTDGEGEQPKIGTVLQPLPRYDARTYLQDANRRRRRRQARWIVGTFLVAAVAGFGVISWLGQEGPVGFPDALESVANGFSNGVESVVAMVGGNSRQRPTDVVRESSAEQGSGTSGIADRGGDDLQEAIVAQRDADPQRGLPAVDGAIESPSAERGSPLAGLEPLPANRATPGETVGRERKSDVRVESAPPTLGIAEAGAEPGPDIGMKELAALAMNAVAMRSPALGPEPLKLVPPSTPPARLALAATVVALTRPPRVPFGQAPHPPAANVAKIMLPASPPGSAMNALSLDAPVPRSLLAGRQERIGNSGVIGDGVTGSGAIGSATNEGTLSIAEGKIDGGAEPGHRDVILGTTVIAARTAGRAATPREDDSADNGNEVAAEASPDGNLVGARELSLAAIRSPQIKPAAATPPSSREEATTENTSIAANGSRRNYVVQLLSVTTEEGAAQELAKIIKRFPDLLEGLGVAVHRAELADRGSRFRVRTAPFGNKADAEEFCSKLKNLKQDCLILRL